MPYLTAEQAAKVEAALQALVNAKKRMTVMPEEVDDPTQLAINCRKGHSHVNNAVEALESLLPPAKPELSPFMAALAEYDDLVRQSYNLGGYHTGHGVGKIATHAERHAHAQLVKEAKQRLIALGEKE